MEDTHGSVAFRISPAQLLGANEHAVQCCFPRNSYLFRIRQVPVLHAVVGMKKVDWHLLEYFRTAGRHQHVSRAAEELGTSQSAVSRAIARLESKLGVKLFERVGRSVVLTEKGRLFLQVVDRAYGEIEEIQDALFGQSESTSRTVGLGFLRTLGTRVVPQIVRKFKEQNPRVAFTFSQNNTTTIEEQLDKGDLDLIFTAVPPHRSNLGWAWTSDQELVLIAKRSHALAKKQLVHLRELSQEPFVTFKPAHVVRILTDQLCRAAGFAPTISFEGDDSSSIPGFVGAGFGIAIVPSDSNLPSSVVVLPTAGPLMRRRIGLAWVEGRFIHSSARAFKTFVLNNRIGGPR
jgi:DNA-binding transcriptional LysR family regulator